MTTPTPEIEVPKPSIEDTLKQFMDFTSSQINTLAAQQAEMSKVLANTGAQVPKPVAPSFDKDQFFTDPDKAISSKLDFMKKEIQEQMAAQLSPINQLAAQLSVQNKIGQYLQYLQNNPATSDVKYFSDIVTNMIQNTRGDIDANTLYGIYLAAKGMHYSKNPPPSNTGTPQTPPTTPGTIPPYISPNSPVTPTNGGGQASLRELNELEKRVARDNGMSPADFLYYGGEIPEATWKAITQKA